MENEEIEKFKSQLILNFQNLNEKLKLINQILKIKLEEIEEIEEIEENKNIIIDK